MRGRWIVPLLLAVMALGACSATQQAAPLAPVVTANGDQDLGTTGPTKVASHKAIRSAHALLVYYMRNVAGTPVPQDDKVFLRQAELSARTAHDGEIIRWYNPATANFGEVIVLVTAQTTDERCRTYRTSIVIDGSTHSAVGSACANGRSQNVGAALG